MAGCADYRPVRGEEMDRHSPLAQLEIVAAQHHNIRRFRLREKRRNFVDGLEPLNRSVQVVAKTPSPAFQLIESDRCVWRGHPRKVTRDPRRRTNLLERRESYRYDRCVTHEEHRNERADARGDPPTNLLRLKQQCGASGENRGGQDEGPHRQGQVQLRQRDAAKTCTDDEHAGKKEHAIARAPQRSVRIAAGFTPGMRREQTAGWSRGEYVVIEFEPGDAEESDDHQRPHPKQPFTRLERFASPKPLEYVDAAPGNDGAPGKERAGKCTNVESMVDGTRRELDRLRHIPEVSRQQVTLHELIAKPPLHPQKPGRGGDRDDR